MVTGPSYSSPNQTNQERTTTYRDSPGAGLAVGCPLCYHCQRLGGAIGRIQVEMIGVSDSLIWINVCFDGFWPYLVADWLSQSDRCRRSNMSQSVVKLVALGDSPVEIVEVGDENGIMRKLIRAAPGDSKCGSLPSQCPKHFPPCPDAEKCPGVVNFSSRSLRKAI